MSYSITKPDAGPSPAIDASQIQTNFSTYATVFSANHTAINSNNQGDHENVILTNQSVDPAITENNISLYCQNATSNLGTQPQLFAKTTKRIPNNPNKFPMQMTYNTVNTVGPVYQSFLPGGYLLYWGMTSNTAVNITLSPAPTRIVTALAFSNTYNTSLRVATKIISSSSFQINSTLTGVYSISWMAIALA
jgi:hypothetical protein